MEDPMTPPPQAQSYHEDARAPPLEGLANVVDSFQVDGFRRAMESKSTGKPLVSKFFGRRSPKTTAGTPATPPSQVQAQALDEILLFAEDCIPTSLLKLNSENASRSVKMFQSILEFMGVGGNIVSHVQTLEIAQKLLHQGLKRAELRDELYMQLLKQTRGNPTAATKLKAWQLFSLVSACMAPSKDFTGLIGEYVHGVTMEEEEDKAVKELAGKAWQALKRTAKAGPRRTLPSMEEIDSILHSKKLSTIVFFLDETFEELNYDASTTVAEAVEHLAGAIKLENYQTFTLFAVEKTKKPVDDEAALALAEEKGPSEKVLDDNRYIADIMTDFRVAKSKEGIANKLVFKKRMFRETDETITEPQFINLSYIQAQHDYLSGQYPVVREDAAQMAALQMQAEYGPTLVDSSELFDGAMEKCVVKAALMSRPREEWKADVVSRYRALAQFSKEDARLQFLRILRSLPYGNAIFFNVKRIEDPIGLLPQKLIVGINKRGVHFFRPVPKEYLHSAELRDIMQFGSSAQAVFFKMRVAGVLHIFQFESKQGEDICMALQTHINDIMMKRYSKAKAAQEAEDKPGLLQASDMGPQYQQHVAELQRQLEEAQDTIDELEKEAAEIAAQKKVVDEQLAEALQRVALGGGGGGAPFQMAPLARALDSPGSAPAAPAPAAGMPAAAAAVMAAAVAAPVAAISTAGMSAGDAQKLRSLEVDKQILEEKVARLEAERDAQMGALQSQLENAKGGAKETMKEKDAKITALVEELGNTQALLKEAQANLGMFKDDMKELSELRELKEDVERRERAQASLIEQQAKRLEELEALYKDEALTRKKIFNQMEDLKGKIRVYCRVRPMLKFELDKGQKMALKIPDELSLEFMQTKDKKREYSFDAVFAPGTSQEKVFEDTKQLIQSAVDGFNVCIFAYGQTGSGKTFTIYGNDELPGLTPRGCAEIFNIINRDSGKASFKVELYMLELYIDDLQDLLANTVGGGKAFKAPRMEIKKDPKGNVTVPGVTVVEVSSSRQLLAKVTEGLNNRHVSATHMNKESSRSHLIITVCIESTNLQTQAVTRGKVSFVDLAGSERVKKSGSAGEQLKEAQAINKSLSALGNVISALATDQGHVPYRDHKLTMLMSDSIGGTAKTLMFVNVSPSDNNLDETQNSLVYAARVNTIKNDVSKNESSKEMLKMKERLDYWKEQAGLKPEHRAYVDLYDIVDAKQLGDNA